MEEKKAKNIGELLRRIFIFAPSFKAEILNRAGELPPSGLEHLAKILLEVIAFQKEEIKKRQTEDPKFAERVLAVGARARQKVLSARAAQKLAVDSTAIKDLVKKIKHL
ncbi:MAG: hypothetical protein PHD72_01135 [Patescibacteria group bacterium]|nr:hypothetical protein [Patescibacteria group bacterium]